MDKLILVVKGYLIGLGKIIPGVSGSLIAITLGVYDKLLEIISHFFNNVKDNIIYLFPIGIGILSAIMSSSKLIYFLLNNYYVITMFFFVGLIWGGIPSVTRKVKLKFDYKIIFILLSFFLIISVYFIGTNDNLIHNYSMFQMFLIGILDAATMIIPGVSGTAIMMILGCYNTVLDMFGNIYLVDNLHNIVPFFIGVIVGVIIISKIINFCFHKFKDQTWYTIIGFAISSSFLLIGELFKIHGSIYDYIIGLFLLFLGINLAYKLSRK